MGGIDVNAESIHRSTPELPVVVASWICLILPSACMRTWIDSDPFADLAHATEDNRSRIASVMRFVYHAKGALPVPPTKSLPPRRAARPNASPPAAPSA